MKQNLLLAALLAVTFNSYATERDQPNGGQATSNAAAGSLAVAGAAALSSSGALASSGGGSASVGSVTVNGDDYDAKRIPVSSAIAPSLTQNVICPIITPNSHAVQFLVFGGSTTGTQSLNAICVAYQLKQYIIMEKMTCAASKEYAKANPACSGGVSSIKVE